MPYWITQCYLPPDSSDFSAFTLANAGNSFSDLRGMQGWVDLDDGYVPRQFTHEIQSPTSEITRQCHGLDLKPDQKLQVQCSNNYTEPHICLSAVCVCVPLIGDAVSTGWSKNPGLFWSSVTVLVARVEWKVFLEKMSTTSRRHKLCNFLTNIAISDENTETG